MQQEMPMGFGMALAQNEQAMQCYAGLSESQKQAILNGTHTIRSKSEMHEYVRRIAAGDLTEAETE